MCVTCVGSRYTYHHLLGGNNTLPNLVHWPHSIPGAGLVPEGMDFSPDHYTPAPAHNSNVPDCSRRGRVSGEERRGRVRGEEGRTRGRKGSNRE